MEYIIVLCIMGYIAGILTFENFISVNFGIKFGWALAIASIIWPVSLVILICVFIGSFAYSSIRRR